jgi:hypothetical protein
MAASMLGWLLAWGFWLTMTGRYHPTSGLAVIVTSSLVFAFASASYCNHLILVPRFAAKKRRWAYAFSLVATMARWTLVALCIIRSSYQRIVGPDSDPNGSYKHFAIDFTGMVFHVAIASSIVRLVRPAVRWVD